ncbi:serine/threonine protein kinase [Streptomyces sp. NBC_01280]|uniref:serine/threonine-protein kinase n=1 Tax=unclassified Streptomyces TaxID=2593676 RepID=UPI002E37003A|nr:serine/threonine-protein kinase [Streptomyces sp. NBC_01280]WSE13276.1 serine/threonine protein kinase [Streptomyces sp. NBC_01397]
MSSGDQEETGGGRLLAGRYRVREQLGRGGMGVVWRAVDEVLGREVALKELRTYSDAAGSELADLGVRMQREARAAARVRHPGVVAVHDVTEADGRPLIVMELVDGPSLDDVLRDRGPLDPREAAAIGAKVLDALAAAHRAGVLHRDVKPGNILLDRSGRVVLTDFGIATMDDPDDGCATHLTRSGELVGSLDYLAPERAQGQDPGPASDVWALGATLYAAVEGASPFRRTSTWSTLTAIVVEPLPEPRRAGRLTHVLQQLMAKDPLARPDAERARELLEAVAAAPADVATAALRQPGPRPRETTVRNVTSVPPPGFGPAPAPVHAPPPAPVNAPAPDEARKPGRTRVLLAVAAVIAVLGAAGATVTALHGSGDEGDRAASKGSAATGTTEPDRSRGSLDGAGKSSGQGHQKAREPDDGNASEKPDPKPSATRPAPAASTPAAPRPTKSGTTGGGGGAESPAPAPACHSAGGGKYDCTVWRTSDSYTASGDRAGVLNAGINYFYCQQNLGRRETYGKWTNVWWAKTDDDSGNTNVFVSDVYLKGGDNNAPLPGLPVC